VAAVVAAEGAEAGAAVAAVAEAAAARSQLWCCGRCVGTTQPIKNGSATTLQNHTWRDTRLASNWSAIDRHRRQLGVAWPWAAAGTRAQCETRERRKRRRHAFTF